MSGNLHKTEGYTLLEMIIVLALMALILSVSLPLSFPGWRNESLTSQARMLGVMLKSARMLAISNNTESLVEADLVKHEVRASGVSEPLRIDRHLRVSLLTARQEIEKEKGAIRFFPDGSSTGGTFRLESENRAIAIHVSWLTGLISQERSNVRQ